MGRMVRADRARYTYFHTDRPWRILVQDEPNDIVITVQHLDRPAPHGKWVYVAHLDQSAHLTYHAHIPPNTKDTFDIGSDLSQKEKLLLGFAYLRKSAQQKQIEYNGDFLEPRDMPENLLEQVLSKKAKNGTTNHNLSIGSTARIIQYP